MQKLHVRRGPASDQNFWTSSAGTACLSQGQKRLAAQNYMLNQSSIGGKRLAAGKTSFFRNLLETSFLRKRLLSSESSGITNSLSQKAKRGTPLNCLASSFSKEHKGCDVNRCMLIHVASISLLVDHQFLVSRARAGRPVQFVRRIADSVGSGKWLISRFARLLNGMLHTLNA